MQLQNLSIPRIWLAVSLPAAVFLISIFLVTSSAVVMNQLLATGITLDLVATAPLIFFLFIRKSSVPNITVVPVIIIGFVIASLIIPKEFASVSKAVGQYFIPFIELAIVSLLIYRMRRSIRRVRSEVPLSDSYTLIKESALELVKIPSAANVVATEMAVIYYSLFAWRNRPRQSHEFTVHRESSITIILITIIFLVLVETSAFHFILIQWNAAAAWIVFALSVYTALQLLGHVSALKRRVISIERNKVHIRYGLFAEVIIPIETIDGIKISSSEVTDCNRKLGKMALLSPIEGHNIILYLSKTVVIEKIYGLKAKVDTVLFHCDDRDRFASVLATALKGAEC